MRKRLSGFSRMAGVLFALTATSAGAQPAGSYSSVNIASTSQVVNGVPGSASQPTGGDLQLSSAGSGNYAMSDGSGGLIGKRLTDSVFAASSLANGTLKAESSVALGSNLTGSPFQPTMPFGHSASSAVATAQFGDSFRAYSGDTPYLWNDGTTAAFHFAIDGDVDLPAALHNPPGSTEAQSATQVYTLFSINVYKAGTLDLYNQLQVLNGNIPADPVDQAAWLGQVNTLSAEIDANLITHDYWYLGDVAGSYPGGLLLSQDAIGHDVDLSSGSGTIDFSFNPGGDFDWLMSLTTNVALDNGWQNTSAMLDFSHTLDASYEAPIGATTYSASGLFPTTLALGNAPAGVPEPPTWAAMLAGFGLVGAAMRRRRDVPLPLA